MASPVFLLTLDWNQILTTGGFAVSTLIAFGVFFNRKVWPFITEYVQHERKVVEGYQQALTQHINNSHAFITAQLDRAQRERAEELKLFIGQQEATQRQAAEGRAQFLDKLRESDQVNSRLADTLDELIRELRLDGRIKAAP